MKVIEPGNTNPVIGQFRCSGNGNGGDGCKALLEVEKDDLRCYTGSSSPYGSPEAVCFRCPTCGEITDLARSYWPSKSDTKLEKFTMKWKNGLEEPTEAS
jgi:hypothetical protein